MNSSDWRQSGRYFDHQGTSVFYRRFSSELPQLLCLHGFPTSSFDYHKVWPALESEFAPVAFDMPGYGFSSKAAGFEYTTASQADVLEKLIEHLRIGRVHILSHDYGNTIVQELLARRSERGLPFEIASICFLNGALFPETHRPILAQRILIGPLGALFGRLIPDRLFKKSLSSVFGKGTQPTKTELDEFLRLFKYNDGRKIAHKLIRYMSERSTFRERWVGALATIDMPFRLINGLSDPVSGEHLVERFREVAPHLDDIVGLPGIGHFPHLEAPELFLRSFFEFHAAIS